MSSGQLARSASGSSSEEEEEVDLVERSDGGGDEDEDEDEAADDEDVEGLEADEESICSCCCAAAATSGHLYDEPGAAAPGPGSKRGSRASCALEAHRNSTASSSGGCCAHHFDSPGSKSATGNAAAVLAGQLPPRPPRRSLGAADDYDGAANSGHGDRDDGPVGGPPLGSPPRANLGDEAKLIIRPSGSTGTATATPVRRTSSKTDCDDGKRIDETSEQVVARKAGGQLEGPLGEPRAANDNDKVPGRSQARQVAERQRQQQQQRQAESEPQEVGAQPAALSDGEAQERETALVKRRYVLAELVETERDYVNDLGKIVEGYLEEIRRQLVDAGVADILTTGVLPPSSSAAAPANGQQLARCEPAQEGAAEGSREPEPAGSQQRSSEAQQQQQPKLPEALKDGKHKIIFGNIEAIFEFHRDHFLLELERCLDEPGRLGPLFKRYERRLNMYVVYCQNKPRSEAVVSEYLDTYFEVSPSVPSVPLSLARPPLHRRGIASPARARNPFRRPPLHSFHLEVGSSSAGAH